MTFHVILLLVIFMEKNAKKRLYRLDGKEAKICGVCGGIAEYLDVDPTIIRIIWAIMVFAFGTGLLAYFICALCMPKKSDITN